MSEAELNNHGGPARPPVLMPHRILWSIEASLRNLVELLSLSHQFKEQEAPYDKLRPRHARNDPDMSTGAKVRSCGAVLYLAINYPNGPRSPSCSIVCRFGMMMCKRRPNYLKLPLDWKSLTVQTDYRHTIIKGLLVNSHSTTVHLRYHQQHSFSSLELHILIQKALTDVDSNVLDNGSHR